MAHSEETLKRTTMNHLLVWSHSDLKIHQTNAINICGLYCRVLSNTFSLAQLASWLYPFQWEYYTVLLFWLSHRLSDVLSHLFSSIWHMLNSWSIVDVLRRRNVVYSWQQWHPSVITTVDSTTLFINTYNNRFLSHLWHFFLIPNRIN
jgi:hypothetical protein